MADGARDEDREERITMQIIVDAYGEEEQALGWYYYLEKTLTFPFRARCIAERATSPLRVGDSVNVVGMPPEEVCEHEMFVTIRRGQGRTFAVPLAQLEGLAADDETAQAIGDWHYWVNQGYELYAGQSPLETAAACMMGWASRVRRPDYRPVRHRHDDRSAVARPLRA